MSKKEYNQRVKIIMEDFGYSRKEAINYLNVVEGVVKND